MSPHEFAMTPGSLPLRKLPNHDFEQDACSLSKVRQLQISKLEASCSLSPADMLGLIRQSGLQRATYLKSSQALHAEIVLGLSRKVAHVFFSFRMSM